MTYNSPRLEWIATDMRTGEVIADLPDLDGEGSSPITILQTMGRYETANAMLPLPTAPENWDYATTAGAAALVLLQDDIPIWGGFVNRRTRGVGDTISLTLATYEAYFDRRYLGDVTFTQVGQNSIVQSLVNSYAAAGPNGGIPIRVQIVNGGAGKLRDRTYYDKDDKTLYSALQDIAGVINGPEWTIGWEHLTNPERYTPVLYVGDRLGASLPAGLMPLATFEMPGHLTAAELFEDFTSAAGATSVMAYSSGQGDTRPQSPKLTSTDPRRPTFEYRFSPSSSITDIDTLTGHAQGKLAQLAGGTTTVSLAAFIPDAPQLGVDWNLGDDVGFQLGGLDSSGKDTVPAFPGGRVGVARVIGWEIELGNNPFITPVLAGPAI